MSKKFLYRDHKGSFKDSMKTVQEFSSKKELVAYLENYQAERGFPNFDFSEIIIEHYGFDKRTG